jgi:hypothetical protein
MFRGLLFSLWRGRNVRELTERYTFARELFLYLPFSVSFIPPMVFRTLPAAWSALPSP